MYRNPDFQVGHIGPIGPARSGLAVDCWEVEDVMVCVSGLIDGKWTEFTGGRGVIL